VSHKSGTRAIFIIIECFGTGVMIDYNLCSYGQENGMEAWISVFRIQ
jgi:hypothetical protein